MRVLRPSCFCRPCWFSPLVQWDGTFREGDLDREGVCECVAANSRVFLSRVRGAWRSPSSMVLNSDKPSSPSAHTNQRHLRIVNHVAIITQRQCSIWLAAINKFAFANTQQALTVQQADFVFCCQIPFCAEVGLRDALISFLVVLDGQMMCDVKQRLLPIEITWCRAQMAPSPPQFWRL